ncbi:MAG: lasso peptide biosynthesis B2 protein [Bacteroidales bacterium]|nr:lasso peptide biosynthesis B2 protein [Bacteroidales bacterium]
MVFYIKRFWTIKGIERRLFLNGICIAIMLKLLIRLLPLKSLIKFFNAKPKYLSLKEQKTQNIMLVRRTLRRIENSMPFSLNCLIKSLTFKFLLNSLGVNSNIELGIKKSQPYILVAHAYLIVDNHFEYLNLKGFTKLTSK